MRTWSCWLPEQCSSLLPCTKPITGVVFYTVQIPIPILNPILDQIPLCAIISSEALQPPLRINLRRWELVIRLCLHRWSVSSWTTLHKAEALRPGPVHVMDHLKLLWGLHASPLVEEAIGLLPRFILHQLIINYYLGHLGCRHSDKQR